MRKESFTSLKALASDIKSGATTPLEVVDTLLERIGRMDKRVRSYTVINPRIREQAKEATRAIKAGKYRGPLHGVPVSPKDLIDTKGIVTSYGSSIFAGHVPVKDARVVANLKERGALILGKTNTHELGFGIESPPTRNPWDLDRIPGGSSGGSGAALVAGMAVCSLGTDAGGSVRIPGAMCGVTGLKPTYGALPYDGVFSNSRSLDHVGPMCRSAEDLPTLLSAAGHEVKLPRKRKLRVGLLSNLFKAATEGVSKTVMAAVDKMSSEGMIETEEFETDLLPIVNRYREVLARVDSAVILRDLYPKYKDKYRASSVRMLEMGRSVLATEYAMAIQEKENITRAFEGEIKDFDVVFTPALPIIAPLASEALEFTPDRYRFILGYVSVFDYLGSPCASVPCGFVHGMPVGMQLVALRGNDGAVIDAAQRYQGVTAWHTMMPKLVA